MLDLQILLGFYALTASFYSKDPHGQILQFERASRYFDSVCLCVRACVQAGAVTGADLGFENRGGAQGVSSVF